MNDCTKTIVELLIHHGALKVSFNPLYHYASGLEGPLYCDNRLLLSYPSARKVMAKALASSAKEFEWGAIGGIATAGIPVALLLAEELNVPFCYVRPEAKAHGRKKAVEGDLLPGTRILLVEDLVNKGSSSMKAVERCEEEGFKVSGLLSLVSYGRTSTDELFANRGLPFKSICSLSSLLSQLVEKRELKPEQEAQILSWVNSDKSWLDFLNC